jgi:RimJ/RimL family protein N-acetyltransferase
MSAFMALSGDRVCLRRWRDEDREAFASINADSRVMEFFRGRLNRVESNAMVDHIEKHFSEHGFGLWAIEVPGVAAFYRFRRIGSFGIQCPFHTLCGNRLAPVLRTLGTGLCNGGGPIST